MDLIWWTAVGWLACAVAFLVFERSLARYATGIMNPAHPWRSAAVYLTCLIFSPLLIGAIIVIHAPKARRWIPWWLSLGRGQDPYSASEHEWPTDRDLFLGMLIQRRKLFDSRLRGQNIGQWLMRDCWNTPEAFILEAVDAYRDLKSGGARDWQIWEKLDTWLNVDAVPMQDGSGISDYLARRMPYVDPTVLALGEKVLSGHIDICCRWLAKTKPSNKAGWPPREWFTRHLTLTEFEAIGDGARPMALGVPAVLHLGRQEQQLVRLKLRMLAGDEIWAFSSPPETWRKLCGRAGIALVRGERVVAHLVTQMN